jgi:Xaa-Pro aminopeptidase
MARDGLDAVIVCGNEYTGFEGAVTYMSGFVIVHRYAYVLLPLEGEPSIVFPSEARYVGEHGTTWIEEQVFVDRPGEWLADRLRGQARRRLRARLRDDRARLPRARARVELVPWDVEFDLARAVKSELELESVRDSVRINTEGFWIFLEAFAPGKTRARGARAVRGVLRRAGLRPADDGHGARRTAPSSRSPATTRSLGDFCCRRSRSPAPAATGSRSRARSAPARRATR